MSNKTDKIMATATVSIALVAAIQGLLAFQEFGLKLSGNYLEIGVYVAIGILTLMAFVLAGESFSLIKKN